MKILAIDTSCDDTSVAILENQNILSNIFWSKLKLHSDFGGVIPHEARRQHEEFLPPVIEECLKEAKMALVDIDYIAVTYGPGLAIALEAGIIKTKEISTKYNKHVVAINHMAGHIYSVLAKDTNGVPLSNLTDFKFPLIALTISGGHTELVLMKDHLDFQIIGETVDDAIGESFDKVGRMLGLDFPAGKYIEELAQMGDSKKYKFPRPMIDSDNLNFSFSGLKTAILYQIKKIKGEYNKYQEKGFKMTDESDNLEQNQIQDIAASFQEAAFDCIIGKVKKAIELYAPRMFVVGGGVIANSNLRNRLDKLAKEFDIKLHYPLPFWLCTDNAAMIGIVANYYIEQKINIFNKDNLAKLDRVPSLRL